ncbi:sulfatase-like hydrolase/transferase, partial [bacterium]|nr:sulfatase-like hydrolase/transferase [bacterium]
MTPLWLTEKWWRPVLGGMAAWAALFVVSLLTAPDVFNAPWTPVVAREIGPEQLDLAVRLQAALLGVHLLLGIWFALPAAFSPRRGSFLLGFISSLGVALAFYFYEIGMRPALLADTATRGDGVLAGWYQLVIHEPLWGFAFLAPVGLMLVYRAIRERSAKEALALAVVGAVTWRVFFYIDPIPSPVAAASPEHPDIVLIAADSLRPDFLGCYGADFLKTPNIDALAAAGRRWQTAISPVPVCVPARASMLTGQHAHASGVTHNLNWLRPDRREMGIMTWPEHLSAAGYRTAAIGKMHFYPWDLAEGFQHRVIAEDKRHIHIQDDYAVALADEGFAKEHANNQRGYRENKGASFCDLPNHLHVDRWVGNRAADYIAALEGNQPFALMVGFPGPHCPYDPPESALAGLDPDALPAPLAATAESLTHHAEFVAGYRREWADLDYTELSGEQIRASRLHYAASVQRIDQDVGNILAAL